MARSLMASAGCIVIPGGAATGRDLDPALPLEAALAAAFGTRVAGDRDLAVAIWCALGNVTWTGPDGRAWGYTFRAAGDVVAALRGERGTMPYTRWYCCGRDGVVSPEIAVAMAGQGWSFVIDR
jgi:hypothetical protein